MNTRLKTWIFVLKFWYLSWNFDICLKNFYICQKTLIFVLKFWYLSKNFHICPKHGYFFKKFEYKSKKCSILKKPGYLSKTIKLFFYKPVPKCLCLKPWRYFSNTLNTFVKNLNKSYKNALILLRKLEYLSNYIKKLKSLPKKNKIFLKRFF